MSVQLEVKNLYKIFGPRPKEALELLDQGLEKDEIFERTGLTVGVQDASFEVNEGEVFVVMGLSGSGKSTLVRMLNRLIEPTSGQVLLEGEDVVGMDSAALRNVRRHKISMVFQSFALMPHQTVLDNTAFGLEVSGVGRAERESRAMDALEAVGLKANANSYPSELSGGMKQRVGLARALATDPTILLMDEAFSALDPLIRTEMQDELLRLQREHQRTVVFITHDLDESMRVGDRIAIMQYGRVVQVGTPEEIVRHPANDYVRSFFRNVDVSQVYSAGDIARRGQVTVIDRPGASVRTALQLLKDYDRDVAVVHDRDRRYIGMVSTDSLAEEMRGGNSDEPQVRQALLKDVEPLPASTSVSEVLGRVAASQYPIPVVSEDGRYLGSISKAALLQTLDRTGEE